MDNQLAYIDQASFLALRALGRAPREQIGWLYTHDLDMDAVRRVHRNLDQTLLGRRIERSPLPFGRHRWVAAANQADVDVAAVARPREDFAVWLDEQLRIPIDPEHGPAWRMAVQPFTGGGAAVTIVVSHSVADGGGLILSIAEAIEGQDRKLGYPPPARRTIREAIGQDLAESARAVPEMAKALGAAIRLGREESADLKSSAQAAAPPASAGGALALMPLVAAYVDIEEWDARAAALGGTSNSLVAAVAVRLGEARGRVGADGLVTLQIPVSERTDGDTRANALTGMAITGDPADVVTTLSGIRASVREGFQGLARESHKLLAPVPLIPLTPKWLLRRLEGMAMGVGKTVGCSNLGDIPEVVNRVDGTDAEFFWARGVDWPTSIDQLNHMGGLLMVVSVRVHGRVLLSVMGWEPATGNSKEELAEQVRRVLADFGLVATTL